MTAADSKGPSNSTREDRLKQALRANLRRRKTQAKARAADTPERAPQPDDTGQSQ